MIRLPNKRPISSQNIPAIITTIVPSDAAMTRGQNFAAVVAGSIKTASLPSLVFMSENIIEANANAPILPIKR